MRPEQEYIMYVILMGVVMLIFMAFWVASK